MKKDYLKENLFKDYKMPEIQRGKVALLCIDMQYSIGAVGRGIFSDVVYEDAHEDLRYYFDRLQNGVYPNVRKLQEVFRSNGDEVVHVKIEALTEDGRERSAGHKHIGNFVAKDSLNSRFIEEVAPLGDEIVISKTASGVFTSTNINYLLTNMGITQLVVVGMLTNECVENTVRAAADLHYNVIVVDDGCAAVGKHIHKSALRAMNHVYSYVATTDELLKAL